ncbi:putative nucleic acid-binding protein [Bacillus sp. RC240]|uniref:hypothetical protein n=1 Tax=Bacillus sp. RC240 TaxID=3156285 RepID=UPI003839A404
MSTLFEAAVMSDTDIIVHMVKGRIFFKIVPMLFSNVYITPKVEEELKNKHQAVHGQLLSYLNRDTFLKRTKNEWKDLPVDKKKLVNQTKDRMRASLDPGELDCYAYSLGMDIDAIISDDKGAKEHISIDSENKKVIITFWDLLILAAKGQKLSWEEAEKNYNEVVRRCNMNLPPFKVHIKNFDSYCGSHPWIKTHLELFKSPSI